MTTILDPSGAPSIIFNRGGVTIAIAEGPEVSGETSPLDIQCYSQVTVVTGSGWLRLPSDAEVGDVVEIFTNVDSGVYLAVPDGETMRGETISGGFPVQNSIFRKVSASNWMRMLGS